MYNGNCICSVIPARGGSKGIPKKNLKKLGGIPLIVYSIKQSLASSYVDYTVVSTEDLEIAKVSRKYGALVIDRPKELAEDTTPTEPVLIQVINELCNQGIEPDYVVLLQPTSPLRRAKDIDSAIETLIDGNGDSLLSVHENSAFLWAKDGKSLNYDYKTRPRRQDKQWEFVENGSIYITKKEILLKEQNRLGGNIVPYIMPDWVSFEIDTPLDFKIVEYILREKLPFLFSNLNKIQLVIFDIDGVFTDGSVYVTEQGEESLKFSRIDGKGIELLRNAGVEIAVISSEETPIIQKRMKKLKISHVYTGVQNKEPIYELLTKQLKLNDDEIAYCGDDLGDMCVLTKAGFSTCPKNAIDKVKCTCHYISPYCGGSGFVRDICDLIINSKNGEQI